MIRRCSDEGKNAKPHPTVPASDKMYEQVQLVCQLSVDPKNVKQKLKIAVDELAAMFSVDMASFGSKAQYCRIFRYVAHVELELAFKKSVVLTDEDMTYGRAEDVENEIAVARNVALIDGSVSDTFHGLLEVLESEDAESSNDGAAIRDDECIECNSSLLDGPCIGCAFNLFDGSNEAFDAWYIEGRKYCVSTAFDTFLSRVSRYLGAVYIDGCRTTDNQRVELSATNGCMDKYELKDAVEHLAELYQFTYWVREIKQNTTMSDMWKERLTRLPRCVSSVCAGDIRLTMTYTLKMLRPLSFLAFVRCYNEAVDAVGNRVAPMFCHTVAKLHCDRSDIGESYVNMACTGTRTTFLDLVEMFSYSEAYDKEDAHVCMLDTVNHFLLRLCDILKRDPVWGGFETLSPKFFKLCSRTVVRNWICHDSTWSVVRLGKIFNTPIGTPFISPEIVCNVVGLLLKQRLPSKDLSLYRSRRLQYGCALSMGIWKNVVFNTIMRNEFDIRAKNSNMKINDTFVVKIPVFGGGSESIFKCNNTFKKMVIYASVVYEEECSASKSYVPCKGAPVLRVSTKTLCDVFSTTFYIHSIERETFDVIHKAIRCANALYSVVGEKYMTSWSVAWNGTIRCKQEHSLVIRSMSKKYMPVFECDTSTWPRMSVAHLWDLFSGLVKMGPLDKLLSLSMEAVVHSVCWSADRECFVLNIIYGYLYAIYIDARRSIVQIEDSVEYFYRRLACVDGDISTVGLVGFLVASVLHWRHSETMTSKVKCLKMCISNNNNTSRWATEALRMVNALGRVKKSVLFEPADQQVCWIFMDKDMQRWMCDKKFMIDDRTTEENVLQDMIFAKSCVPKYMFTKTLAQQMDSTAIMYSKMYKNIRKHAKCYMNRANVTPLAWNRANVTPLAWNVEVFGETMSSISTGLVRWELRKTLFDSGLLEFQCGPGSVYERTDTFEEIGVLHPGVLLGFHSYYMSHRSEDSNGDLVDVRLDVVGEGLDLAVMERLQSSVNEANLNSQFGIDLFFLVLLLQMNCYMRDRKYCIPRMKNVPHSLTSMLYSCLSVDSSNVDISRSRTLCNTWLGIHASAGDVLKSDDNAKNGWRQFGEACLDASRCPDDVKTHLRNATFARCQGELLDAICVILKCMGPALFHKTFIWDDELVFMPISQQRKMLLRRHLAFLHPLHASSIALREWISNLASDRDVERFISYVLGMDLAHVEPITKVLVRVHADEDFMKLPYTQVCLKMLYIPDIEKLRVADEPNRRRAADWMLSANLNREDTPDMYQEKDGIDFHGQPKLLAKFLAARMEFVLAEGCHITDDVTMSNSNSGGSNGRTLLVSPGVPEALYELIRTPRIDIASAVEYRTYFP